MEQMSRILTNDRVDAALALLFMAVVIVTIERGLRSAARAWREPRATVNEAPHVTAAPAEYGNA
jgi:carbon starvation protein